MSSLPFSIEKEVALEVSQIGKGRHDWCAIRRQTGKCIMPREGVFAKVIRGGFVRAVDKITVIAQRGKDGREDREIPYTSGR